MCETSRIPVRAISSVRGIGVVGEAQALERFSNRLANDQRFEAPAVIDSLTTSDVLTMTFMDGQPIDTLATRSAAERDAAAAAILELALREVFDWGLVQTDPNFANYLYQTGSGRIHIAIARRLNCTVGEMLLEKPFARRAG